MPPADHTDGSLSVLSTKLEEDFIAPLTAIRGALEILRDFPDLTGAEHQGFVAAALEECARIERGIDHLGAAVYAGDQKSVPGAARVNFGDADDIAELDFGGLTFDGAERVNAVFDRIEADVAPREKRWWFLVNYTDCHVFPEAWIAFAHRGKKLRVEWGYGTIRYDSTGAGGLPDRTDALAEIAAAKALM